KADYIFQTDSDGQTLPEEFEDFWIKRTRYDAVLGDRRDRQDGMSRVFVENTLRMILRLFFGVRIPDANAPFRLMKRELVEKYIDRMPGDFNLPNVMLTTFFVYYKEKILFSPVTFKPRQGGKTSVNIRKQYLDQKSTRLNSSHVSISYVVLFLKKKNLTAAIV